MLPGMLYYGSIAARRCRPRRDAPAARRELRRGPRAIWRRRPDSARFNTAALKASEIPNPRPTKLSSDVIPGADPNLRRRNVT